MIKRTTYPAIPVCDHYAGSEKTIVKSLAIQGASGPVLDVTLDFEDGAGCCGREAEQRLLIGHYLNSEANRFGRVGVRVHALDTGAWQGDVDAVIVRNAKLPAYINVPKAGDPAALLDFSAYVKRRLAATGFGEPVPIHIMVEDARGLLNLERLLGATPVECVSFGLLDFVSSFEGAVPTQCLNSPGQFEHPLVRQAKTTIAMVCHAFRVIPSHSITSDIEDPKQAYEDAKRAREQFGYLRMWSIHPGQINSILEAFLCRDDEAGELLAILKKAEAAGWAPVSHNGCMHDIASYRIFVSRLRRTFDTNSPLADEVGEVLGAWARQVER